MRRGSKSVEEELAMVRERLEPGQSVSVLVRCDGINPSQLFHWRKLYQDGNLSAVSGGEAAVPASEMTDTLKQIRELQRMLGKKTKEVEILNEAVEIAHSRKWIAPPPLIAGERPAKAVSGSLGEARSQLTARFKQPTPGPPPRRRRPFNDVALIEQTKQLVDALPS